MSAVRGLQVTSMVRALRADVMGGGDVDVGVAGGVPAGGAAGTVLA